MKTLRGIYALLLLSVATAQMDFEILDDGVEDIMRGAMDVKTPGKKFYPSENTLADCGECSCREKPQCEIGVSVVTDGCGCCKVCAKQLGQRCDARNVCDHHKGLHCDKNTGTCKARPGRSCHVADKWYENGALFSPNCRVTCYCTDGDLACRSKCKPAPPGCHHPKLVRSSSNCCGQWRCSNRPREAVRGSKSMIEFKGSCVIQSTDWSPCTKTCGFGVSERVTNNNAECKLAKETRLCIIRPCKGDTAPRKSKRSCRKSLRQSKRIRYSISGCLSVKSYRPKYCGTCRHSNKCCRPQSTKTVNVEFKCDNPDGSSHKMTRKMMTIQNCECGNFCSTSENDIFSNSFRSMRNNIYPSIR